MARDDLAYLRDRVDSLSRDVATHDARLDSMDKTMATKVSAEAFMPVKLVVYGLVTTVALGALKAVLALVHIFQ